MQSTIQTNDLGAVVASKWAEPKSRHGIFTLFCSSLPHSLAFQRKKKVRHGDAPVNVGQSTDGGGFLRAIRRSRELKEKLKTLPSHGYFSSNHILINNDRVASKCLPLVRRRDLDDVARTHARAMADSNRLFYSDPSELASGMQPNAARHVGQSIVTGTNVREAHGFFRDEKYDRRNLLDPVFKFMGTGTAWSADGKSLYVCYVFEG